MSFIRNRIHLLQNSWPDDIFKHIDYRFEFTPVPYTYFQADPDHFEYAIGSLSWQELKEEICQNRPFIFVVKWGGG